MITLSLNILDIIQNSIRAKASRVFISIRESEKEDIFKILIEDNGSGIPQKLLPNVTDPFITTRKTRSIGLGLPLLKYHANLAGGDLSVDSREGEGTKVNACFQLSHIDRQPLGDIAGVMTILMEAYPEIEFIYSHKTDTGEYVFSSKEIKEYLEIDNFNDNSLLQDIKQMINQNLKDAGVADFKNSG
jgi:light-regulated signal transduction histidine kinase (bacteriophytochrome)